MNYFYLMQRSRILKLFQKAVFHKSLSGNFKTSGCSIHLANYAQTIVRK